MGNSTDFPSKDDLENTRTVLGGGEAIPPAIRYASQNYPDPGDAGKIVAKYTGGKIRGRYPLKIRGRYPLHRLETLLFPVHATSRPYCFRQYAASHHPAGKPSGGCVF